MANGNNERPLSSKAYRELVFSQILRCRAPNLGSPTLLALHDKGIKGCLGLVGHYPLYLRASVDNCFATAFLILLKVCGEQFGELLGLHVIGFAVRPGILRGE